MVVGPDGTLPLPWLADALRAARPQLRGHATLLHAHAGDGALELALALAAAWLCQAPVAGAAPCGHCESCRLVRARLHPDLCLVMPEELRRLHDWPLAGDRPNEGAADDGKGRRKPSRQIRIDEVRSAIDWIVTTPGRGRAKVLVLHPATALNLHAANALLKTLEEPPASARLVLTAEQPQQLLATVRSRCQGWRLAPPDAAVACDWLQRQGVDQADTLLAAADGHPLLARDWHHAGWTAAAWTALPAALQRGATVSWPAALLLHGLRCLCHDLMCRAVGVEPRYFPAAALASCDPPAIATLSDWQQELLRLTRQQEHPWNEGLLLEAVLAKANAVISGRPLPATLPT